MWSVFILICKPCFHKGFICYRCFISENLFLLALSEKYKWIRNSYHLIKFFYYCISEKVSTSVQMCLITITLLISWLHRRLSSWTLAACVTGYSSTSVTTCCHTTWRCIRLCGSTVFRQKKKGSRRTMRQTHLGALAFGPKHIQYGRNV